MCRVYPSTVIERERVRGSCSSCERGSSLGCRVGQSILTLMTAMLTGAEQVAS